VPLVQGVIQQGNPNQESLGQVVRVDPVSMWVGAARFGRLDVEVVPV
jgi:hypothetical protein